MTGENMAQLNKEAYEGKREWAAKIMAANREKETLTEDQCDAIEELCSFRHELHCNQKALFHTGSSDYSQYWDNIGYCGHESDINEALRKAGLPIIFNHEEDVLPTDDDVDSDEYETDDDYQEEYDELLREVLAFASGVNKEIENYLRAIDEEYGTEYAPSGATRL